MKLSNEVFLEILSREYGWLPSQIRNEKFSDLIDYLDIIKTRNNLEQEYSKKYGGK